jgi:hypothetical protein
LKNTDNEIIKNKTKEIIYESYEKWAIKQSYDFKKNHTFICKNIREDELALYGCMGLKKAIINYSPEKCGLFTKYANFYVTGELYKGVKKLKPIHTDILSVNILKYKTYEPENFNFIDDYSEKWNLMKSQLNSFEYRCATHKYSFDFVKIMSNNKISKLMSCSEETVRKAIVNVNNIILQN